MVCIEKSVTRVTDRHYEACRVTDILSVPYTHDRYFFLHTFELPHLILKVELAILYHFFLKEILLEFKEADATSDRRSVLYLNV